MPSPRLDETPVRAGSPFAAAPIVGTPSDAGMAPAVLKLISNKYAQDPRFANRLQRLLSLSNSAPTDGYLGEIIAALLLNAINTEDVYPEEKYGYGILSSAPAGATISMGELFNPANSGVLVVVEQITLAQQTLAALLGFSFNTAQLGGGTRTAFGGDSRGINVTGGGGGGGVKALITFDAGSGAKPGTATADFWQAFFPAGSQPLPIATRIVLCPGLGLLVASGAAGAQTTSVGVQWREVGIPSA